ncbi:hypothetical protein [Streptomyces sp. NPDC002994]|uniref:hypothetical protein n=1 Tax=Streptomyces sp. NPDC002994 TaxID=3154441 RepID=UPI0033BADA70
MSIHPESCFVIRCDVCNEALDSDGFGVAHFATGEQATAAAVDEDWTVLAGGRISCSVSDPEHDDARDAAALTPA